MGGLNVCMVPVIWGQTRCLGRLDAGGLITPSGFGAPVKVSFVR